MSGYRNIGITLTASVLLHVSILCLYPFDLPADVPEKNEVKVVFKIKNPGVEKIAPVKRKVRALKPRQIVKRKNLNIQPRKIPKKTMMAKLNQAIHDERKTVAVKKITRTEAPVFTYTKPLLQPEIRDDHEKDRLRFNAMVLGRIEKGKVYPEIARRMGMEGDVLVSFTILPDGTVSNIEVHPATKCHRLLKKAAVTTIEKAAPYLPVPSGLKKDKGLRMKIKIAYKIT